MLILVLLETGAVVANAMELVVSTSLVVTGEIIVNSVTVGDV